MSRIPNNKRKPSGLRNLRETLKRTQPQFAAEQGIPPRTLQDWESRGICPEKLGSKLALQFGIDKNSLSASDGIARSLSGDRISKEEIDSWKKALETADFGEEYDQYVLCVFEALVTAARNRGKLGKALAALSTAVESTLDDLGLRSEISSVIEGLTRKEWPIESIDIKTLRESINGEEWQAFADVHSLRDCCEVHTVIVQQYRPIIAGTWDNESRSFVFGGILKRQELTVISPNIPKRRFTSTSHSEIKEIIGKDAKKMFRVNKIKGTLDRFRSPEFRKELDLMAAGYEAQSGGIAEDDPAPNSPSQDGNEARQSSSKNIQKPAKKKTSRKPPQA